MPATKQPSTVAATQTPPPPTLVCIDVSYLLFYRINALKRWHQHAHKHTTAKDKASTSSAAPDLCTDLFRTKLCERLDTTVLDLAKTHRATHVLLAFDGRRNWRKDVHAAYKGTRTHDDGVLHLFRHGVKHLHTSFGVGGTCIALPLRGRKKLPPPAYTLLAHDALEADDIVHELAGFLDIGPAVLHPRRAETDIVRVRGHRIEEAVGRQIYRSIDTAA